MVDWNGIWIPLVTPFRGGCVDHAALARLVRQGCIHGAAGFVACGSTGEAAMLDPDEQDAVLATVLDAAGVRPVLMGLTGVRPERVAARAAGLAQHTRVAAFLLAPPAYVKPSQAGIVDFFLQVAESAPRPVVVYDIPSRTGVRIEPASLLALADHPRIAAVKDCSGDRATAEAVLADGRLALLAGNDDELFDQLARGAAGGITASSQVATSAFVELHRRMAQGELAAARALWRRLAPLTQALFVEPNPAPIKAVLAHRGLIGPELRAPMRPVRPATLDHAEAAVAAVSAPLAA